MKSHLLLCVALLSVLCGCGRDKTGEKIIAAYDQSENSASDYSVVSGYNEPTEAKNGVGLRAAAKDQILTISVRNDTLETLTLGPDAFRLVLPDGLYAFDPERDDMKGFPIRDVEPASYGLFTVGVAGRRDLAGFGVVLNYPPADVLMQVLVEPVGQ